MEFDWDVDKDFKNIKKHGVSFEESAETFFDPKGLQLRDAGHSNVEERLYWVGKSRAGRILTTWFTKRGNTIRIIGCAEWRKFRKLYETT